MRQQAACFFRAIRRGLTLPADPENNLRTVGESLSPYHRFAPSSESSLLRGLTQTVQRPVPSRKFPKVTPDRSRTSAPNAEMHSAIHRIDSYIDELTRLPTNNNYGQDCSLGSNRSLFHKV